MQYLYEDGDEAHFMDPETYDQFAVPRAELEEELPFMQPSRPCRCSSSTASRPVCSCPPRSSSTVAETEPGVKGDTVSNVTKPATLETGAVVQCRSS